MSPETFNALLQMAGYTHQDLKELDTLHLYRKAEQESSLFVGHSDNSIGDFLNDSERLIGGPFADQLVQACLVSYKWNQDNRLIIRLSLYGWLELADEIKYRYPKSPAEIIQEPTAQRKSYEMLAPEPGAKFNNVAFMIESWRTDNPLTLELINEQADTMNVGNMDIVTMYVASAKEHIMRYDERVAMIGFAELTLRRLQVDSQRQTITFRFEDTQAGMHTLLMRKRAPRKSDAPSLAGQVKQVIRGSYYCTISGIDVQTFNRGWEMARLLIGNIEPERLKAKLETTFKEALHRYANQPSELDRLMVEGYRYLINKESISKSGQARLIDMNTKAASVTNRIKLSLTFEEAGSGIHHTIELDRQ